MDIPGQGGGDGRHDGDAPCCRRRWGSRLLHRAARHPRFQRAPTDGRWITDRFRQTADGSPTRPRHRAGGRSSSSVSKTTTRVVAGECAGSKRTKAERLGIRFATPAEFTALVADLVT
ncbi:BRCT domain-containing protein [Streptomyces sp. NPDC059467]|uniref:BRCT domain-containing protein n=1 Tax=Streptomyces sp. NPDC059467 TaxID=3346844 RepID=UPI003690F7CF